MFKLQLKTGFTYFTDEVNEDSKKYEFDYQLKDGTVEHHELDKAMVADKVEVKGSVKDFWKKMNKQRIESDKDEDEE